jgi:hypothetical protein
MAATSPQANNVLLKYRRSTIDEYIRGNWFSPYLGDGMDSIIRIFYELKSGGDQINIPLIARAKAQAISTGTLVGNEEKVDDYGFRMWIDWARNAFKISDRDEHRSSIDLVAKFKPLLDNWGKELQRDEICQALYALPSESAPSGLGSQYGQRINGILFDAATLTQRNTWTTDNADRILFGDAFANLVASNFGSSMNNITTAMRVSYANMLKLKRLAQKSNPRIHPYKSKQTQGREWFVCFMGQEAFRDAANDATIIAANTNARAREGKGMDDNPLFQGGDLLIDGIIIRQVPELSTLLPTFYVTAGAGGIRTAPIFMCGQSALGLLYGQMPKHTFLNENDYGFYRGTGIQMAYGIGKIAKKNPAGLLKEWGIATQFVYAPSDT